MTPATASSVPTPIAPLASQAPGAAAVTAPSGSSLEHVLFIVLGLLVLAVAALLLLRFLHSLKQRRSGLLRLIGVEALGARSMSGVADNLSALYRQRSDQRGHARIKSKDDAPIADVIGLIAREQLLGATPPGLARAMVDMWRADMESRRPAATSRSCANLLPTRTPSPAPRAS